MKKYMLATAPMDQFYWTMSFEEFKEKLVLEYNEYEGDWNHEPSFKEVKENMAIAAYIIEKVSTEYPHTIELFGIPNENYCEICIVAKIRNNGTTYYFSDNLEFLKSICKRTDKDIYKLSNEITITPL